jgi:dienelactone hydrolase
LPTKNLALTLALLAGPMVLVGPAQASPGPAPGPPALHAPAAHSPLLENTGRWDAVSLMISGAAAYSEGEYVYQDYLYDDYGANTTNLGGADPEPRPPSSEVLFGGQTGDVVYPTAAKRFGYNAADLVEFRVDLNENSLAYRITLNTLLQRGATAIAIGIDTDGGKKQTNWGHRLGSLGPLDLEHVVYTDGIRAQVDKQRVETSTDVRRNQIEVVIPSSVLDPGHQTWRHYLVTGIADGNGGFVWLRDEPSKNEPGGAHGSDAPPVFNVGFRFESQGDEPMGDDETETGGRTVGYGHWRDHGQAKALAARDISKFAAKVNFFWMQSGNDSNNARRWGYMNRIYVSSIDLGEGVAAERPWLLGQLQPYTLYVPKVYRPGKAMPLNLALHSLACTYNQFAAFAPNIYRDLGEDLGALVLTTMGRGPDGWYHHEAELDVFEAWADVARNYDVDFDHVGINGYSMGGHGTFKLATQYPDLFGRAFPIVGPPAEGIWLGAGETVPPESNTSFILENLRNIPLLIWNGAADELVPVAGVIAHANRLDELGYRFHQEIYTADHFALSLANDFDRGEEFLSDTRIDRNPWHVTYKVMPAADVPKYGLVHDHAYWLWDIEARDKKSDGSEPATGLVDARSLAAGLEDPASERTAYAGVEPLPHIGRGRVWLKPERAGPKNALELQLVNIASVTMALERAGLDPSHPLALDVSTDGRSVIKLVADFEPGTRVYGKGGKAIPAELNGRVLTIRIGKGEQMLRVLPG